MTAREANGKISEANFFVRKPWSSYLLAAREAAVKMPQKASTHCESWYGHFSSFLTRKHLPDARLEQAAEESFREVYALMFDEQTHEPIPHPGRIQNTSAMISMLVDIFAKEKAKNRLSATGDNLPLHLLRELVRLK